MWRPQNPRHGLGNRRQRLRNLPRHRRCSHRPVCLNPAVHHHRVRQLSGLCGPSRPGRPGRSTAAFRSLCGGFAGIIASRTSRPRSPPRPPRGGGAVHLSEGDIECPRVPRPDCDRDVSGDVHGGPGGHVHGSQCRHRRARWTPRLLQVTLPAASRARPSTHHRPRATGAKRR